MCIFDYLDNEFWSNLSLTEEKEYHVLDLFSYMIRVILYNTRLLKQGPGNLYWQSVELDGLRPAYMAIFCWFISRDYPGSLVALFL